MGWELNDGSHEGWTACVAPDGRLSGASSVEGLRVPGVTGTYPRDPVVPDHEVVPHAEIIGWRGACSCGWTGELWERVTASAMEDFSKRRAFVSLGGFANPSQRIEDAVRDEWRTHTAPAVATAGVEAAARDYVQAGIRLDKTVAAAKAAGATWADIGRAVGITRQAAHERWNNQGQS